MRFLLVDRILQLIPGQSIRGIKHITYDDYYLCATDKQALCFIPSLIGETLGQLAAWNVMLGCDFKYRPVAGIVDKVTFYRNAWVGETLYLEAFIDALDEKAVQYHAVAWVGEEAIVRIDGALGPLLPMAVFIDDALVRRQFDEINRPGTYIPHTIAKRLVGQAQSAPGMQFDAIIESTPGVSLSAVKHITKAASYFADHFPNKPVLPMTILLECTVHLAREWIACDSYQLQAMRKIKMNEFVQPGDTVLTHLKVKNKTEHELILTVRSEVDGKRVCVLELVFGNNQG